MFGGGDMVNIEKLKELRLKKDMTQIELGLAAGISQSHYSMIENGKDAPSIKRLAAIANALGCSVKDLVTDDD